MPFFSSLPDPPLPNCGSYSESSYCGAHKWLSEEKGMQRERVGSGFKRKAPRRGSFSVIKFVARQKELQFHSSGRLEGEGSGVIGRHSSCQSISSSAESHMNSCSSVLAPCSSTRPHPAHSGYQPVSLLSIWLYAPVFSVS